MNFKRYHVSKNLFDANNADYSNFYVATGDVIGSAPDVRSIVIPCEPNTTYTLSKMLSNRFSISTLNAYPTFGMSFTGNRVTDHSATTLTIATGSNDIYLLVMIEYAPTEQDPTQEEIAATIMLNTGSQPLPYEPYGDSWLDSHYIMGTDTDTITTLPADIYVNDTTATVGLKGNMSQTGTPTPDNPIQPSECGERTGNLCNESTLQNGYFDTTYYQYSPNDNYRCFSMLLSAGTYTIFAKSDSLTIRLLRVSSASLGANSVNLDNKAYTFTLSATETIYVSMRNSTTTNDFTGLTIMLNTGDTALPYEPYGYKIPISSANTTTPVYLGEVESTRQIRKLVLTGNEGFTKNDADSTHYLYYRGRGSLLPNSIEKTPLLCNELPVASGAPQSQVGISSNNNFNVVYLNFGADVMNAQPSGNTAVGLKEYLASRYAAGTPVCVWYVLATPQTAIVNEPLRKIGDYADTVSGITIPTITGKDTFDVQTTLKPSEVSLAYTGWHDASVKEAVRTVNIYDKYNTIEIENVGTRYGQYVDAGVYSVYNNTDNIVYWGSNSLQARQVACNARSTATFTISGDPSFGIFMPYNDDSLGEITIVKGSTVPDHYIPYIDWD